MSPTLLEALVFLVLAALVASYGWVLYQAWAGKRALQDDARKQALGAPNREDRTAAADAQTTDQGVEQDVN